MCKVKTILLVSIVLIAMRLSYSQSNDLYLQTSEMNDLMVKFNADHGIISRFYSSNGNRSEWWSNQQDDSYNSPERRERLLGLINDYLIKIDKLDFEKMNINGKVDYLLFKRDLEDEKYKLEKEAKEYTQVVKYLPFSERIYALQKPRRRGLAVNGQDVAKELNDVSKQIKKSIDDLQKGDSVDSKQAKKASDAVKGLQGTLKDYFTFYNGYDPLFTWWAPKTYSEVDSLLSLYATSLKKKSKQISSQKDDGSGIIGNPIGREELIRQLKLEFIPYTPEELVDIANKEFAWCDVELLKASKEMGFGENWKAAQEKVKNSYGKQENNPRPCMICTNNL